MEDARNEGTAPGTHLKVLGWLTLALTLPLLLALFAFLTSGWAGILTSERVPAVRAVLGLITLAAATAALAGTIGGLGLVKQAAWARRPTLAAAVAIGALALFTLTLFGLVYSWYAFWVLRREDVRALLGAQRPLEAGRPPAAP